MVILYEEIKTIKKINEIKFRIDNLMSFFFFFGILHGYFEKLLC